MDLCKLKISDTYIKNNSIYRIVIPFKQAKGNPKILYGLSRYIGDVKNNDRIVKK